MSMWFVEVDIVPEPNSLRTDPNCLHAFPYDDGVLLTGGPYFLSAQSLIISSLSLSSPLSLARFIRAFESFSKF